MEYVGAGGLELYTLYQVTKGYYPIVVPFTSSWVMDTADLLYVHTRVIYVHVHVCKTMARRTALQIPLGDVCDVSARSSNKHVLDIIFMEFSFVATNLIVTSKTSTRL